MYSSLSLPASRSAARRTSSSSRDVARLAGAGGDRRQAVDRAADLAADGGRVGADLAQDGADDALLLVEQREQQVRRRGLGVAPVGGDRIAACSASWDLMVKRSELHRFLNLSRGD